MLGFLVYRFITFEILPLVLLPLHGSHIFLPPQRRGHRVVGLEVDVALALGMERWNCV